MNIYFLKIYNVSINLKNFCHCDWTSFNYYLSFNNSLINANKSGVKRDNITFNNIWKSNIVIAKLLKPENVIYYPIYLHKIEFFACDVFYMRIYQFTFMCKNLYPAWWRVSNIDICNVHEHVNILRIKILKCRNSSKKPDI